MDTPQTQQTNPGSPGPFLAGRGMPRSSIGYHIDCTDNPLDLRPVADLILRAIDERRAQMPADRPLVVLIGKNHAMSTHNFMEQMVAQRLLDENKDFTVCIEHPHNLWADIAREHMGLEIPENLYYTPGQYDTDGQAALSAFLSFLMPVNAPFSNLNAKAFYYTNRIKYVFNDAAKTADGKIIDLDDPLTSRLCPDRNGGPPVGIATRNRVMAELALDHAKKHKSSIILQDTGEAHIFGNRTAKYEYKDSLCAIFKNSKADVLPVFITQKTENFGLNTLPAEAYPDLAISIVIDGLPEYKFATKFMALLEEDLAQKISAKSGENLKLFDIARNIFGETSKYQAYAYQRAKRILKLHAAAQSPEPTR